MARDPRYDVLFEPVRLGPKTARNRFYQVPHCNGMGYRDPSALAAMRGVKAEGGWAVVSTEETEIHPSSETTPWIEGRIWDDADLPAHRLVADAIHAHGSLAAIELVHNGMSVANYRARIPPMGPGHQALMRKVAPTQARAMDLDDISDLRRWHREAVLRAIDAGYDIVYVYAGHALSTLQHFLSPLLNRRTDRYGGPITNRMRLLREVIEDTMQVSDGQAAVACRLAVHDFQEGGTTTDDIRHVLVALGDLPDLWDFMVGEWEDDSVTSRFGPEGGQEEYVAGLKSLTSKPVVGVGRFTSPDTMVRMVRRGVLDLIGAARPSIADPYLPRKVEEGRMDEIRECIGCNICVSGDMTMSPIRCTQNPSMGEEWRRGWHPETVTTIERSGRVLVVGSGPAGLEAAMVAGKRGCEVVVLEQTRRVGGRVTQESALPGLAAWRRVVDYRLGQIDLLPNVEVYRESTLTADEILDHGFHHVAVATGARWRNDGCGLNRRVPFAVRDGSILTPDHILDGERPEGRVVIYDDDHYYLGGVIAELLATSGAAVTLVTPEADVSHWTHNTLEQGRIQRRLLEMGVEIVPHRTVEEVARDHVVTRCVFTGRRRSIPTDGVVTVTARLPQDDLAVDLKELSGRWGGAGLRTVRAVGDAYAPGTIAAAVWDGRRFAEELAGAEPDALFRRNVPLVG